MRSYDLPVTSFIGCGRVEQSCRRMARVNGDKADLQAQFSLAYVQAVASVAGFFVTERGSWL